MKKEREMMKSPVVISSSARSVRNKKTFAENLCVLCFFIREEREAMTIVLRVKRVLVLSFLLSSLSRMTCINSSSPIDRHTHALLSQSKESHFRPATEIDVPRSIRMASPFVKPSLDSLSLLLKTRYGERLPSCPRLVLLSH